MQGCAEICGEHKGRAKEYWCLDDKQLVCCDCLILGTHRGHSADAVFSKNQETSRGDDSSNESCDTSREMVLLADLYVPCPSPDSSLETLLLSLCHHSLDKSLVDHVLRLLPSLATTVDDGVLTALLTSRPGSLLTALRHLLTTHHTQPSDAICNLLTCLLSFTAGVLCDPSPALQLAVFHAGTILAHRSTLTGLSLMEDLASLCNADDPSILSPAVHCLAALVSKKCCLVLVPSHLPCLVKLIKSSNDVGFSAAVQVVHCIATTEASRETLTKAGAGVGLLLPALSKLLLHHRNPDQELTPKCLSLVLDATRSLLYLLNPGALSPDLVSEMTASLSSLKELGEGHERLIDSITGQRLMLPQHRNVRQFPTIDTRERIRVLEKEFLENFGKLGPGLTNSKLQSSKASTEESLTVEERSPTNWLGAGCSDESTTDEDPEDKLAVHTEFSGGKQLSAGYCQVAAERLPACKGDEALFQHSDIRGWSLTSAEASKELPGYDLSCSEIPYRSVWDSHCHLDFLARKLVKAGNVGGNFLMRSLQSDGQGLEAKFGGCIANFCDPWDWTRGPRGDEVSSLIEECCLDNMVFLTLGCHPHFADRLDVAAIDHLRRLAGSLKGQVVAIGECGFDTSPKNKVPLEVQKQAFGAQVEVALALSLPLVLHIRGAEEEAWQVLRKKKVPSDWPMHYHCFKGSVEQAEQWLRDYPASKIGLTGLVTFPNARQVHEVARHVPLEKILLETDAPYFLPEAVSRTSYQYNFSQPGHVVHAAAQVAALRGISLSEVLSANMKNIQEVYGIKMQRLSGASKENDLYGRRGFHINLEMVKNSADLLNVASQEINGEKTVPAWIGGEDDSSDDSEGSNVEGSSFSQGAGEEKRWLGTITDMAQPTHSENKCPTSDLSSPSSSPVPSPTPTGTGTMLEAETIVKGEYLSLCQGPSVELLGVDKFRELVNSYGTLATIICSFLNGREGGELYIGVRKSGEILGVALTRKQRDDVRQVVDRVVSQMIEPRLPTMLVEGRPLVEITFLSVLNPGGSCSWLKLPRVRIAAWPSKTDFKVVNVRFTGTQEGCFVRRGEGTDCRSLLQEEGSC